ncbi:MAG: hypothetical protein MJA27_18710 [Pseudanabaenales cyanobacterium]|nr:hypothetical protein [Pseudanabaenales cyanobacterium]
MTDAANLRENFYSRKLYAFLRSAGIQHEEITGFNLHCLQNHLLTLGNWWDTSDEQQADGIGQQIIDIAASSDRVNLHATNHQRPSISIRHPISGESGTVDPLPSIPDIGRIPEDIRNEADAQKVFWWFWRFYPELWLNTQDETLSDGLLYPAHRVLPDCPLHSHQATVSALTGSLFPNGWQKEEQPSHPYLLIFTFSPIQDFIKASRK